MPLGALAIGSAVVGGLGAIQQHQAQSAMAEAQTARYEQNRTMATRAYNTERQHLRARRLEEQEATMDQMEDVRIEGLRRRATARVAAGEAGVFGRSVDAREADLRGQEGTIRSRAAGQLTRNLRQIERQKQGLWHQKQRRINSMQPGVQPSSAALALNIAGSAVGGAMQYQQLT